MVTGGPSRPAYGTSASLLVAVPVVVAEVGTRREGRRGARRRAGTRCAGRARPACTRAPGARRRRGIHARIQGRIGVPCSDLKRAPWRSHEAAVTGSRHRAARRVSEGDRETRDGTHPLRTAHRARALPPRELRDPLRSPTRDTRHDAITHATSSPRRRRVVVRARRLRVGRERPPRLRTRAMRGTSRRRARAAPPTRMSRHIASRAPRTRTRRPRGAPSITTPTFRLERRSHASRPEVSRPDVARVLRQAAPPAAARRAGRVDPAGSCSAVPDDGRRPPRPSPMARRWARNPCFFGVFCRFRVGIRARTISNRAVVAAQNTVITAPEPTAPKQENRFDGDA